MLKPYMLDGEWEAGCDEAGRGCLCGPVVCAAVVLPPDFRDETLNDSKQLTEAQRDRLATIIREKAIAYAVVEVSAEEIDEINILNASIIGMHRAVRLLSRRPRHLLIDGNRFRPFPGIPHTTVVHGDATYASIAAASILAKTHRDALMRQLAEQYPGYGWERNMGYPTKEHREALKQLGITPLHRRSYGPVKALLPENQLTDLL